MRGLNFLSRILHQGRDNPCGNAAGFPGMVRTGGIVGLFLAVVLAWMALPVSVQAYVFYEREDSRTPAEIRRDEILGLYEGYKKLFFRNVNELTVDEALQMLRSKKTVLVDVRDDKEREVSAIPLSVDTETFKRQKAKYTDYAVIVYSTVGKRGGIATKRFEKEGSRAYNLVGGLLMWVHQGQPIVDKSGPTQRVHVYDKKWSILPEGFEGIY
jgi:rhodanese-related sulfurtransferase